MHDLRECVGIARNGQLRQKAGRAENRSGDELGKKGNVEQGVEHAHALAEFAPVAIHHERNCVKDEKGNAERQKRRGNAHRGRRGDMRPQIEDRCEGEACVFEVAERGKANRDAKSEPRFSSLGRFAGLNLLSDESAEERDAEKEWDITPVPKAVEDVTREKKEKLVQRVEAMKGPRNQQNCEKEEGEFDCRKEHWETWRSCNALVVCKLVAIPGWNKTKILRLIQCGVTCQRTHDVSCETRRLWLSFKAKAEADPSLRLPHDRLAITGPRVTPTTWTCRWGPRQTRSVQEDNSFMREVGSQRA